MAGRNEWLVIQIEPHDIPRARREMASAAFLYTPLRVRFYRVRNKYRQAEFPLLPGYAFVRVADNPSGWRVVRNARGVIGILTRAGEFDEGLPWACAHDDVRRIRRAEKAGDFDQAKKYFDALAAKAARRRAQRGKKYRLADLQEVMNIKRENAA